MKKDKRIQDEVQAYKSKYHDLFKRLDDSIDFDEPMILDTPIESNLHLVPADVDMNRNVVLETPPDDVPSKVPVDCIFDPTSFPTST